MPTKSEIYRYWEPWLIENDCYSDHISCWACGREFYISRFTRTETSSPESIDREWNRAKLVQICHIIPRSLGGLDTVDNLFLLCRDCHDLAPDTPFPGQFLKWVLKQSYVERQIAETMRAVKDFELPIERADEIITITSDPMFKRWAKDHTGFHASQKGFGAGIKQSTMMALISEYLWYLDHTQSGGVEATS